MGVLLGALRASNDIRAKFGAGTGDDCVLDPGHFNLPVPNFGVAGRMGELHFEPVVRAWAPKSSFSAEWTNTVAVIVK